METASLVLVIMLTAKRGADAVAGVVGAYVALAIWSTSSMAFMNPAVTISRVLTDTVTGIAPAYVFAFVIAQLVGAVFAA